MNDLDVTRLLGQMRAMSAEAQGIKPAAAPAEGGPDFAALLKSSIDSVNEAQQSSNALKESFISGKSDVGLAEVMVAAEKASLSFKAMSQVRSKLMDAYKEVMRMQV